jgi:diaminopimelate epimerase
VVKIGTDMTNVIQPARMIPFVKAHANGNDFLVIDDAFAKNQHAALARKICARTTGVGADGIEFLERRSDGIFFLRLFNADGSEAELSGNGTRCVAAWLAFSEQLDQVVLATHGGPRACSVIRQQGTRFDIESEMGVPWIHEHALGIPGIGAVQGAVVNVGNPHFVLFVENEDFRAHGRSWQELGAMICTSPLFPEGTNVEFVRVLGKDTIAFRIYERGCGPTASSGTGTCASATAAIALRGCDRTLTAHAEGGPQSVAWPANDKPMKLTGPAEIICMGEVMAL